MAKPPFKCVAVHNAPLSRVVNIALHCEPLHKRCQAKELKPDGSCFAIAAPTVPSPLSIWFVPLVQAPWRPGSALPAGHAHPAPVRHFVC